ncbi:MAG: hypothetical protein C4344_04500, partial [Acidimicrobiia bacterium]
MTSALKSTTTGRGRRRLRHQALLDARAARTGARRAGAPYDPGRPRRVARARRGRPAGRPR